MALAVIYGLAVATILTLIVVPSMYAILGRKEEYYEEHRKTGLSDVTHGNE